MYKIRNHAWGKKPNHACYKTNHACYIFTAYVKQNCTIHFHYSYIPFHLMSTFVKTKLLLLAFNLVNT
ncbi:hypothetical protein Hanom_Chr16g01446241 [Helianthus anomalus]